jgi:hypothetical protein
VDLVRIDVSDENIASIIRATNSGSQSAATSNWSTLWVFLRSVLRLLVTANVVPSSLILVNLTRATRHNIPEDGILHSHRTENLKSYKEDGISPQILQSANAFSYTVPPPPPSYSIFIHCRYNYTVRRIKIRHITLQRPINLTGVKANKYHGRYSLQITSFPLFYFANTQHEE